MNTPDTLPHDLPPGDGDDPETGDDAARNPLYGARLKSFVKRAGRTTGAQSRAFSELGPLFLVPYKPEPVDLAAAFGGREAPTVLEIGFGMGEATAHIATVRPDTNFFCCEVHEPGVGALLKRIGEQSISNIRICAHDAVDVLDHMLQPGTLAGVHVFFPDPWHKKRHNKRRLIQPELRHQAGATSAPRRLHPLRHRLAVPTPSRCSRCSPPSPCCATPPTAYAPKPDYRPLTKFENRGIKLGHGVWDLVFERRLSLTRTRLCAKLHKAFVYIGPVIATLFYYRKRGDPMITTRRQWLGKASGALLLGSGLVGGMAISRHASAQNSRAGAAAGVRTVLLGQSVPLTGAASEIGTASFAAGSRLAVTSLQRAQRRQRPAAQAGAARRRLRRRARRRQRHHAAHRAKGRHAVRLCRHRQQRGRCQGRHAGRQPAVRSLRRVGRPARPRATRTCSTCAPA